MVSAPLDAGSVFIRPGGFVPFSSMQTETAGCGF